MENDRRQNLDSIIAKLSKEEKHRNGAKGRILLVSEKKNACLPLLSSDEEGEGADLHQCGHCKLMFSNLTKYITHKIQKVCWIEHRKNHREDLVWSPHHRGRSCSPDDTSGRKDDNNAGLLPEQERPDNVNQSTEAENRKHHNVYGQAANSPQTSNEDRKTPSGESVSAEEGKLNKNNEREEDDDEDETRDNNNAIDFMKKNSDRDNSTFQSEIDLNSRNSKRSPSHDNVEQSMVSPRHSYNSSPVRSRTGIAISLSNSIEPLNKYDRLTPNLPPIMSTRGSNRVDGLYPVDKMYQGSRAYPGNRQNIGLDDKPRAVDKIHRSIYDRRDERYSYGRYHPPRYEAETESTWTSSYLDNRKNPMTHSSSYKTSEAYYLSRERFTTMVGLDKDKRNGDDNDRDNDEYEKNIKIETVEMKSPTRKESTSNIPPELVDERLAVTPPELVRVEPSDSQPSRVNTPVSPLNGNRNDDNADEKYDGDNMKSEENDGDEVSRNSNAPDTNLDDSLDDETTVERPKFMEICSPDKESGSPLDIANNQDIDDLAVKENLRDSSEAQLLAHHRLSESAVEQLITVPVSGVGDPSWKHAKQVYSCPLCAKVFPFKSKLQRHVLVHTRIKPYKCTVCGRGFTQQIDLQRHLTRHTGEKPFKCHLCTAQFIRADNLRKHCKDAHYVVIEEPIRKRRRRTTGSDTVLPSLEVAIALAFSETERNGGRVLGRTVTRANPRTPSGSGTTTESFNSQYNQNSQKSSSDVSPFIGEHHTAMFSQSSSRYPGPPEEIKSPYSMKMNEQFTPGSEDKEPFSPQRKSFLPRDMPRLYENGHMSRGYLPPPDYDRDRDRESQEYMILRDKDRRQIDPRAPPSHMSTEQRYKMEYRPLSAELPSRSMVYRRTGDTEKDYRRRYPDPRIGMDDIDRRDKYSMYSHRTSGSTRSPDMSHGQYDPRRQIEIREITNRAQIDDYESSYRYNKSYQRNDSAADPGEYVSMATEKDNDIRMRSYGEDDIKHSAKNGEFIKSAEMISSQYAVEEEIPIVTRSDELPSNLDAT